MGKLIIDETTLKNIGDAIREKTGTTNSYSPAEMAAAILNITTSGNADEVINRTVTEYASDTLTEVGRYAFHYCKNLTTVDLPNVTTLNSFAFNFCTALNSVNLPNLETVSYSAFESAGTNTLEISLPKVTTVHTKGFWKSNIVSLDLPLYEGAEADTWVFRECENLTEVNLPKLSYVSDYAFAYSSALTEVNLPSATIIDTYAFYTCESLTKVDLGNAEKIYTEAFSQTELDTLILRKTDAICQLPGGVSAFAGTPISNGTGYIYVPSALIEEYKANTQWSNFAERFREIEIYL